MKNLANCSLREFIRQTNKIRKAVKKWMDDTRIVDIRSRVPAVPDDADEETRAVAIHRQGVENVNAILDAALEKYPDETAEIIGLCCFKEGDELDELKVSEILGAAREMIDDPEVVGFFTSLARLGMLPGSGDAKA